MRSKDTIIFWGYSQRILLDRVDGFEWSQTTMSEDTLHLRVFINGVTVTLSPGESKKFEKMYSEYLMLLEEEDEKNIKYTLTDEDIEKTIRGIYGQS